MGNGQGGTTLDDIRRWHGQRKKRRDGWKTAGMRGHCTGREDAVGPEVAASRCVRRRRRSEGCGGAPGHGRGRDEEWIITGVGEEGKLNGCSGSDHLQRDTAYVRIWHHEICKSTHPDHTTDAVTKSIAVIEQVSSLPNMIRVIVRSNTSILLIIVECTLHIKQIMPTLFDRNSIVLLRLYAAGTVCTPPKWAVCYMSIYSGHWQYYLSVFFLVMNYIIPNNITPLQTMLLTVMPIMRLIFLLENATVCFESEKVFIYADKDKGAMDNDEIPDERRRLESAAFKL